MPRPDLLGNQIGAFYLQQILDELRLTVLIIFYFFFYTILYKETGLSGECDYKGLVFNPLQNRSAFSQNQYL